MELVLKLHALVDPSFRGIQDRYGDMSIGFEKLEDMRSYGVLAQEQELPITEGFEKILSEVQRGHYPLLSVYSSNAGGWHIWAAIPHGDSFCLVSRAFGHETPLTIEDLSQVKDNLTQYRSGKVHFVTYEINN